MPPLYSKRATTFDSPSRICAFPTVKELNIYVKTDQQAAAVLPKFW